MPFQASIVRHIQDVSPARWDALAGDNNPFVEHAFLFALEHSGCVGTLETGWLPHHIVVHHKNDLVAAMPTYIKTDSYGEYIFDWGWARASQQAGLAYYPKLVTAVPFTPATGPRLLLHPNLNASERTACVEAMTGRARELSREQNCSSHHVLFCEPEEQEALQGHDFLPRSSYQFHWQAESHWTNFDDYLAALKSRVRKQIKKERRQAAEHGLRLVAVPGSEMTQAQWDALWQFYRITISHKWAQPYLTHEFFKQMPQSLAHRVVGTFAMNGDEPMAGALLFHKGDQLFGRYWGCRTPLPAMHFELCYYLPIEYCLSKGINRFEAGAQGQHKLKRGFMPSRCLSGHRIEHPGLRAAIAEFLPREDQAVDSEIDILADHGPFRCPED